MSEQESLIRNISDTALWVAVYRAQESERPDAVFHDPYARRLAGERGEQIATSMKGIKNLSWPFVSRTFLFDRIISNCIAKGVDQVINLAAGLDTRPYRMKLPASLKWVEVDLPDILTYKEGILANEKPVCVLERVRLDVSDVEARRKFFTQYGSRANRTLIVTEGLLIYLSAEEVGSLATDLAATSGIQYWTIDLASPGVKKMMEKNMGSQLDRAGAPFKFAPEEGPGFFTHYGWKVVEVNSSFKTAARLKRLPFLMRFFALFPESNGKQGDRPWSGICLFEKQAK